MTSALKRWVMLVAVVAVAATVPFVRRFQPVKTRAAVTTSASV